LPDGTPAVVVLIAYSGSLDDGERLLHPLRECAPLLADQVGPLPYTALQSIVENFNPPGLRNYWKSNYLRDLSDAAIEVMVDHYASALPAPTQRGVFLDCQRLLSLRLTRRIPAPLLVVMGAAVPLV
jgi:hypothetical protein